MGRKTNRREFLGINSAGDLQASGGSEATSEKLNDSSLPQDNALMLSVSRRAMACQFEIRFPAFGNEHDAQLALETLESLESLEEQMSLFRPSGEIGRVNLSAAEGPVQVEVGLFELLCMAKDIWWETEGAYDITSTALWQVWGFARRAGSVPKDEQIAEAMSRVGFQYVELDSQCHTIKFSRPGIQLNLGSMGKGYALDKSAAKLIQGGIRHFLIHAGQSSILVHGGDPSQIEKMAPEKGEATLFNNWTIGIPHPWKANRRIAEVRLRNRAIGTSSMQFQSFRHKGKLYGHIIDPRTGRPATGLLSVTVIAPSSALADALSTAFYVLGLEKSLAYCQAHPEIGAVLLTPSSRGGDLEIHCSGLDDCDFVRK